MGSNFNEEEPENLTIKMEESENSIKKRKTSSSSKISSKSDTPELSLAKLDRAITGEDVESVEKKLKYPKSVFFIISNEFCERFSYYGFRTILTMYLTYQLKYNPDTSTVIYHIFTMFCYFFPVIGGVIADNWLGKFRTILYLSIVYAVGNVVVSGGSFLVGDPENNTDAQVNTARALAIFGLCLIAIGTGGIKPCVSAFGGDQFILPQQKSHLEKFFSLFYFSINAGSLLSTFLTPILREDVHCPDTCYPVAFGVPAILMIVSIVVFIVGKPLYIIKAPEGNILVTVCKCIGRGIKKSFKKKEKVDHWLDRAVDKYGDKMVDDVKATLRVLLLFVPLPIFWALFDQQGSKWTFQATRMTGKFPGFTLKPDQMQVVNPLLILIFIPLFNTAVYPILAKCKLLKTPLQRMVVGGTLAGIAFFIAAGVETQLESTYAVLPKHGEAQLRIHNNLNCAIKLTMKDLSADDIEVPSLTQVEYLNIKTETSSIDLQYSAVGNSDCDPQLGQLMGSITLKDNTATSFIFSIDSDTGGLKGIQSSDENVDKSDNGDPQVRVLFASDEKLIRNESVEFISGGGDGNLELFFTFQDNTYTEFKKISADKYKVKVNGKDVKTDSDIVELDQGGVYTFAIFKTNLDDNYVGKLTEVTSPNKVNMLWLIPQYVVITAGEVMFSVTGLEFAFTQAPASMKSVLTSCWLLTVAIGNLVVVIIAEAKIFKSQVYEFLLFAVLMIVDMIVFALMTLSYEYVDRSKDEENVSMINSKHRHSVKSDDSSLGKY